MLKMSDFNKIKAEKEQESIPQTVAAEYYEECLPQKQVLVDITKTNNQQQTNQVTVKARNRRQDRCILVADLYNKCKNYCDSLIFTTITDKQFIEYVNYALEDFYNLNPNGWNFTLSEPYPIELKDNFCVYELPEDFRDINYVAAGTEPSNCMPARQVFKVVPYQQWDTVQNGFFVSYRFDSVKGIPLLYFRTPNMPCGCYDYCPVYKKLTGKLYVKYYKLPEMVSSFSDKICELPKQWGAENILVQIIAKKIHASKGRPFQENESFLLSLQTLKRIDKNLVINSPIHKSRKFNFLLNNKLIN